MYDGARLQKSNFEDTNAWKSVSVLVEYIVCAVSFYHAETPIALIKQQLTTITRNTFRHCRVRLYAFVGQPFTEQLYLNQRKSYSAMLWLVFLLHGHADTKLVRVALPYVD